MIETVCVLLGLGAMAAAITFLLLRFVRTAFARPKVGPESSAPRGRRTEGPDEPERRVLTFNRDARKAISRRAWRALLVCGAVWLVGVFLVFLAMHLAPLMGIRRSTFFKVLFCVHQPPLAVCLVVLIADWRKGKVTHEGLIASLAALMIFWWSSAMLLGSAGNYTYYGD